VPSPTTYGLFVLTALALLVIPGTVADRLRGTPAIARVERWFGETVLVGLGVASALVASHRSS